MPPLETLDEGQRALLQLLLKQRKSYDELADLLKSDPTGLRQRAHEAVEALGPVTAGIGRNRRNEVADYLLGQQTASQRAATREFLEGSAAGRTWARAAAGALRPIAPAGLPDVPAEPEEVEQAFDALDRRTARQEEVTRSSRAGGMLLFAALGLVLAIGLLWAFDVFDTSDKPDTASTTAATTEAPQDYETLQLAVMKPVRGGRTKAEGVAAIARTVGTEDLSLAIKANDVAPSPSRRWAYAVWLYSSPSNALLVGFPPLVGDDKELEAAFQLAKDTGNYKEVLVTRETVEKPTRPGPVVLRGSLQLVPPEARGGDQGTTTTPPKKATPPG
ncbi:MAG: hypothetical protein M3401_08970 [Actinomycetota bacterium]|nr:hypothetical protein [Actinomycetota bacterium]